MLDEACMAVLVLVGAVYAGSGSDICWTSSLGVVGTAAIFALLPTYRQRIDGHLHGIADAAIKTLSRLHCCRRDTRVVLVDRCTAGSCGPAY